MLIWSDTKSKVMTGGCTSGAKIIGDRCYLLKNRDLVWSGFRDTLVFENDVFFVTGIDVKNGNFSGASLGLNRYGLSICNTTVLVTEDQADDILLEKILRETKTIPEAFELVQQCLDRGERFHWCNFILASPNGVGVIEIGDGVAELEEDPSIITRTNHHLLLPTNDVIKNTALKFRGAAGRLDGSKQRRQDISRLLPEAKSMMDMIQLLGTHRDDRGFNSICRHLSEDPQSNPHQGETVYSYVIETSGLQEGILEFRLNVTSGNPCSGTFKEFTIDFNSPKSKFEILTDYP